MAKFAVLFSYTAPAWKAMVDNPSDRMEVVREAAAAAGGTLDAFYWMFGGHDGLLIADFPDSVSAGAVSVAVSAAGAISHVTTHELLDGPARMALLEKAKHVSTAYRPPSS